MQRLLHEGMDAGLCGFSIQRLGENSTQADFDGSPMVTDTMCDEDILALGRGAGRAGRGLHPDHPGDRRRQAPTWRSWRSWPRSPSGRSCTTRSSPPPSDPEIHRRSLRWIEKCWNQGLPIYGQTATLRAGFAFTLEHWNLYDASPAWRAITTGTKEEKLAKMRDPDLRQAVMRRGRGGRQEAPGHPGRRGRHAPRELDRAEPSTASPSSSSTWASRSARSPRRRASTPSRSCWTCRSRAT